jgi:hypothetical protein
MDPFYGVNQKVRRSPKIVLPSNNDDKDSMRLLKYANMFTLTIACLRNPEFFPMA